jgi:hypothetical protein
MKNEDPIEVVASQLGVLLNVNDSDANKKILAARINELIQLDFQKLISILYRLDVSEKKLKTLLEESSTTDAGYIITELIIERQIQKIKSRQQFRQPDNDIDENEKW